jgi:hypothetical protein
MYVGQLESKSTGSVFHKSKAFMLCEQHIVATQCMMLCGKEAYYSVGM